MIEIAAYMVGAGMMSVGAILCAGALCFHARNTDPEAASRSNSFNAGIEIAGIGLLIVMVAGFLATHTVRNS